jgi:hypothetical protein
LLEFEVPHQLWGVFLGGQNLSFKKKEKKVSFFSSVNLTKISFWGLQKINYYFSIG